MKAKWVNIVDRLQGNVDQRHYARRIPGNGEWGCRVREAGVEQEDKEKEGRAPDRYPMETGGRTKERRMGKVINRHDMPDNRRNKRNENK